MKERIWLSPQEYNYGNDSNLEVTNPSKIRKSIADKSSKSINTIIEFLSMGNIPLELKRNVFPIYDIEQLTSFLIVPSGKYDSLEEYNYKLSIASAFIKSGLAFYRSKFKKSQFVEPKIKEFENTLKTLNEIANDYENTLDPKFQFFKKRMQMSKPPLDKENRTSYWQVECSYSLNYSTAKSKKLDIRNLNHEKFCKYKRKDLSHFLTIIPPEKQ